MKIYTSLEQLELNEKTAVALGNFDGLHVGHRVVMEDAVKTAGEKGYSSLCFTFSNHPFNFILQRTDDDPDAVKLICTEAEKVQMVKELGFDILVNVPFDETIMTMRADAFFEDIIIGRLNAGYVSVGFNYTYGARAEGRPALLTKQCEAAGIGLCIHDEVSIDGMTVSSTLIRKMIAEGNMEMTAKYLGRPYSFEGTVSHGRRLGSKMGIPTANITVPARQMLPPNGVYFSRIRVADRIYSGVSNIGVNPTVSPAAGSDMLPEKRVETNIFDFDSDIYGVDVTVYFDHFSRGERKFADRDELFAQINRDCENARQYHRENTEKE